MTEKTSRNGFHTDKTGATAPARKHSTDPKPIHLILQINQHMNTASEKLPLFMTNKTSHTSQRILLNREEKKAKLYTEA